MFGIHECTFNTYRITTSDTIDPIPPTRYNVGRSIHLAAIKSFQNAIGVHWNMIARTLPILNRLMAASKIFIISFIDF